MRTINLTYPHQLLQTDLPETVCAIGFFDGIHRGHLEVINSAVKIAKEKKMESAVITFHPHPIVVLKQDADDIQYITPLQQKQRILQKLNVDRLYIITFNKELSMLSPKEFIHHFLVRLHIKHVVAGFDFSYGHKGQGNMEMMESLSNGLITTTTIAKVEMENEKISSTKIRNLLKKGDIKKTNELLGRVLEVTGTVIEGDKRGRTIGFPTANLKISEEALLPKTGVYAVKIRYQNMVYEGMANLGYKPTFANNKSKPSLEVHIFDYNNNLYGEELKVEWHVFIREEKKFNSVEELITQIKNDELMIREYFYKESNSAL